MGRRIVYRILGIILLAFIQALFLNKVHLINYATPFLYVYIILKIETGVSRNQLLLWAFFAGLFVDMLSNTPGVNAAATTFAAFVRPHILDLFLSKDNTDSIIPSSKTMGRYSFLKYVLVFVFIHHALLFFIEQFTVLSFEYYILNVSLSVIITVLFVLAFESIRKKDA